MAIEISGTSYARDKEWLVGTHRACRPAETVERWVRLMPRFGITRLANVTGLDVIGMPVWVAIRPNSRGLSVAQGKGADHDSARASALMESIESWHGERVERPLRHEAWDALRRATRVVDVSRLPLRAGCVLRTDVPALFVEGWDLGGGGATWVPYESVTTNFVAAARGGNTFLMSSNGLASGNHLLEATTHALCELVERDALTLWYLLSPEQSKARQLDLATIDDAVCRETLQRLAAADVGVAAWDITSDLGIPAYCSVIHERGDRPRWRAVGMFSGYGCHLEPGVALMRSLSEAVQSRLTMISGSRDDLFYRDYAACSNDDDLRRMVARLHTPPGKCDFRARRSLATPSFEGDLEVLLGALRGAGLDQAVVVDLTREDIGIPVVKVVVPGLEAMSLVAGYTAGARAVKTRAAAVAA